MVGGREDFRFLEARKAIKGEKCSKYIEKLLTTSVDFFYSRAVLEFA
jgi:hypothetical protein